MNNDQEIKNIFREILKWTKFQGIQSVKEVLEATLDTDDKKLAYELSDGRSSSSIAESVEVGDRTVQRYWKEWTALGIAEIHPSYKRRSRRVFSLNEVGIEVPETKESISTTEEDVKGE